MLGTWLSARELSSFEMIFKTVYIERETERDMAWTRELWVCCVAFGIRILAVELLGPAGYTVGCAGIELILVHPMDA